MDNNRIEEFLRDPTLDRPTTEYFHVRLESGFVKVSRETAARILTAISGDAPPRFLRVESITGSVVFVRTDAIVGLSESTRAQRAAERRMWRLLEEEDEEEDDWKDSE